MADCKSQTVGDCRVDFPDRNNNFGEETGSVKIYSRAEFTENTGSGKEKQDEIWRDILGIAITQIKESPSLKSITTTADLEKQIKEYTSSSDTESPYFAGCLNDGSLVNSNTSVLKNGQQILSVRCERLDGTDTHIRHSDNEVGGSETQNQARLVAFERNECRKTDKANEIVDDNRQKNSGIKVADTDDSQESVHVVCGSKCSEHLPCASECGYSAEEDEEGTGLKSEKNCEVDEEVAVVETCDKGVLSRSDSYAIDIKKSRSVDNKYQYDRHGEMTTNTGSIEAVEKVGNNIAKRTENYLQAYIDTIRRCDEVINGFQKQNQNFIFLSSEYIQLKRMFASLVAFNVFFIIVFVPVLVTGVVKPLLHDWDDRDSFERVQKNVSTKMERIHGDYVTVSSMVNDLMTRTRSVMQLTSDGQCNRQNDDCFLRWSGNGIYHQGSLHLSSSKDSVMATSGGFYMIYCKVLFSVRMNTTTDVMFQYEVLHRHKPSTMPVVYAFERFTADAGSRIQEVSAQTIMYLQPSDEIIVRLATEQASNIARFPAAHAFGVLEVS